MQFKALFAIAIFFCCLSTTAQIQQDGPEQSTDDKNWWKEASYRTGQTIIRDYIETGKLQAFLHYMETTEEADQILVAGNENILMHLLRNGRTIWASLMNKIDFEQSRFFTYSPKFWANLNFFSQTCIDHLDHPK